MDNASYFRANGVEEFAAEVDDLELLYLPLHSHGLNLVEECWSKLSDRPANRVFHSVAELKVAIREALRVISLPGVRNIRAPDYGNSGPATMLVVSSREATNDKGDGVHQLPLDWSRSYPRLRRRTGA